MSLCFPINFCSSLFPIITVWFEAEVYVALLLLHVIDNHFDNPLNMKSTRRNEKIIDKNLNFCNLLPDYRNSIAVHKTSIVIN